MIYMYDFVEYSYHWMAELMIEGTWESFIGLILCYSNGRIYQQHEQIPNLKSKSATQNYNEIFWYIIALENKLNEYFDPFCSNC